MDYFSKRKISFQTLLIINDGLSKLNLGSSALTSFNRVCLSIQNVASIVPWVQEHQPDLIILDLKWSEVIDSQLISTLRLDWLTRNIPILLITDTSELQPLRNLDYDALLSKSCSSLELEQTISSLTSLSAHQFYGKAV